MPYGTFLNGRTPSQLRGLQWLAMSDTGAVYTRTYTTDAGGGASQVWVAGSAVPCKIESVVARGQSSLEGGRIDERSEHVVTVPAGTNVDTDDRFVMASRGTFEVTAVRQASAEWVREFEVIQVS
jgi:hypothetical protein